MIHVNVENQLQVAVDHTHQKSELIFTSILKSIFMCLVHFRLDFDILSEHRAFTAYTIEFESHFIIYALAIH